MQDRFFALMVIVVSSFLILSSNEPNGCLRGTAHLHAFGGCREVVIMAELLVLVYCKTGLFHYMWICKMNCMTKLIVRLTDKYIADAYGQSIYRII